VAAVRELADNGELGWLPETHLAQSQVLDPA
jgi:hypothetical protein